MFSDISHRLDEFRRRDDLLGWAKTQWFAPQAFGNETFWTRYPTAAELQVMTLLAVNHGAKGITMWDFPTTGELYGLTKDMAAALFTGTDAEAPRFLIGAPRWQGLTVLEGGNGGGGGGGWSNIDAAVWVDQASARAMVSVVNLEYNAIAGPVTVRLAVDTALDTVSAFTGSLWGGSTWEVGNGSVRVSEGLAGLETAVFLVSLG